MTIAYIVRCSLRTTKTISSHTFASLTHNTFPLLCSPPNKQCLSLSVKDIEPSLILILYTIWFQCLSVLSAAEQYSFIVRLNATFGFGWMSAFSIKVADSVYPKHCENRMNSLSQVKTLKSISQQFICVVVCSDHLRLSGKILFANKNSNRWCVFTCMVYKGHNVSLEIILSSPLIHQNAFICKWFCVEKIETKLR